MSDTPDKPDRHYPAPNPGEVYLSHTIPKQHFYELDVNLAQLYVRLNHDNITRQDFYRQIVRGYINKNEHIMNFFKEYKENSGKPKHKETKRIRKRKERAEREEKEISSKFQLNNEEVDNIFDILEEEYLKDI